MATFLQVSDKTVRRCNKKLVRLGLLTQVDKHYSGTVVYEVRTVSDLELSTYPQIAKCESPVGTPMVRVCHS